MLKRYFKRHDAEPVSQRKKRGKKSRRAFQHYQLTYKTKLAEIENDPILFFDGVFKSEGSHGFEETLFRLNVILQLHVVDALRLSVHHEEGVIQILFRPPPFPND